VIDVCASGVPPDSGRTASETPMRARAAAVMFEARVGCLPVVERGALVGIVTECDLPRALAQTLPSTRGIDPDTYFC
jgi:CBS domain-containing protein